MLNPRLKSQLQVDGLSLSMSIASLYGLQGILKSISYFNNCAAFMNLAMGDKIVLQAYDSL